MKFKQWLLARLRERSTWAGIVSMAAALGIAVSPEQSEAIVAAGMAVVGAVIAFTDDKDAK